MAILKPDITYNWNGLKINEYLLTKHNINKIDMPTIAMSNPIGITVHNTESISVSRFPAVYNVDRSSNSWIFCLVIDVIACALSILVTG